MNRSARILICLWLVIASVAGSPTPCHADSIVTLHDDVVLTQPTVRLSDLFNGVPPVIDRDIAQAPLPGQSALYDANLLSKLADKYRLEWHPTTGTPHITVTSACTRIPTDAIREAVIQKIKDSGARGDIDITFDARKPELALPANQPDAFALANFDYDPLSKRFRTEINAGAGQAAVIMPLAGRVTIKRHVPVLARKLESGTIIGLSDIDWLDVPEDRLSDSTITDAQQLVGRELRHTTADNEPLRMNDVLPPRLVTRGSLVTMKIETPMMVITTQGKALQDGAMGEVVRVLNTQSNRMIEGTVDGSGSVRVSTAQKLASAQ